MDMTFFMPVRIVTGSMCIDKNKELLSRYGRKCLIVTGKNSAKLCGAYDDTVKALDELSIGHALYDGIGQNPTFASCAEAASLSRQEKADFIIGIGGGSPLDAAKAVAVLAADDGMTEASFCTVGEWKKAPLPVIAVGTTAGTGSEVTPVAVITNSMGQKKSVRADSIYPAVAFGDARYTAFMSEKFTRSTAVDALAHCCESYFNRKANALSCAFAFEGLRLLKDTLPRTAEEKPLTENEREILYAASLYGGLAISVTGTAFPHTLGYYLSEECGIPHGFACGIYLPAFLEHNRTAVPEDFEDLFGRLGIGADELEAIIRTVCPLPDLGFSEETLSMLKGRYTNNGSLQKTPGYFDENDAIALITSLFGSASR